MLGSAARPIGSQASQYTLDSSFIFSMDVDRPATRVGTSGLSQVRPIRSTGERLEERGIDGHPEHVGEEGNHPLGRIIQPLNATMIILGGSAIVSSGSPNRSS